jgi:hypothetical protein
MTDNPTPAEQGAYAKRAGLTLDDNPFPFGSRERMLWTDGWTNPGPAPETTHAEPPNAGTAWVRGAIWMRGQAAKAASSATPPEGYQWGEEPLGSFDFGKERAAAAIDALPVPGEPVPGETIPEPRPVISFRDLVERSGVKLVEIAERTGWHIATVRSWIDGRNSKGAPTSAPEPIVAWLWTLADAMDKAPKKGG